MSKALPHAASALRLGQARARALSTGSVRSLAKKDRQAHPIER